MNKLELLRNCAQIVRDTVSPEQALTRYVPGFEVRKDVARCVFHREKTASMRIYRDHVHCYGCHFHGDTVEIVRRLFDLSMQDALVKLDEDFGLHLPLVEKPSLRTRAQIAQRAELIAKQQEELHAEDMAQFEHKLDLEHELCFMLDLAEEFRPYDPDAPIHPLFVFATKEIEVLRHRIGTEG